MDQVGRKNDKGGIPDSRGTMKAVFWYTPGFTEGKF